MTTSLKVSLIISFLFLSYIKIHCNSVISGSSLYFNKLQCVAISPDEKLLAIASNNNIIIWDVITNEKEKTLKGHKGLVKSISWSSDGKYLASGSYDNTIKIWDISSGINIQTLNGHKSYIYSVSWSPDGKYLASGSWDNTIKIWEMSSGDAIRTLRGHTGHIYSVSWSPDGNYLVSGSWDNTIKIWDVSSGDTIRTLRGHTGHIYSVSWSPDGKYLASGSGDKTIRIWDISSGKTKYTLKGHKSWIESISWNPNGFTLASGSDDNTIKVWDITSEKEILTLNDHTWGVHTVFWIRNGSMLLSGSYDNTVRFWNLKQENKIFPPISLSLSGVYIPIIVREYQGVQSTNKDVNTYFSPEIMLKVNVYDRFSIWANYTKPLISTILKINSESITSNWNGNAYGIGIGYDFIQTDNRWGLSAYLGYSYYESNTEIKQEAELIKGHTIWRAFSLGGELSYRPVESVKRFSIIFRPVIEHSFPEDLIFNAGNHPVILGHSLLNINMGIRYIFN